MDKNGQGNTGFQPVRTSTMWHYQQTPKTGGLHQMNVEHQPYMYINIYMVVEKLPTEK